MSNFRIPHILKCCPKCGKPLNYDDARICHSCGFPIQNELSAKKLRNPWIALILGFFVCGWGHWYNGKTWEGVKYFGIFLVLIIIFWTFVFTASLGFSPYLVPPVVILIFLITGIWIYSMYDAYHTAVKINEGTINFSKKSRLFWLPVALILISFIIAMFGVLAILASGPPNDILSVLMSL